MTNWKECNEVAFRHSYPALACTDGAHKKAEVVPPHKIKPHAFSDPIVCIGEWCLYKSPFMSGFFAKHQRSGSFYIHESYQDKAIEIFKARIRSEKWINQ